MASDHVRSFTLAVYGVRNKVPEHDLILSFFIHSCFDLSNVCAVAAIVFFK
jgi:hypothetical protein